jgi:DNA polymerase lambda
LKRLEAIPGFGPKVRAVIKEFADEKSKDESRKIETCKAITSWENGPQRRVVKSFKEIFGVGMAEANRFYAAGYRSIADIRKAMQNGKLGLTRNQKVGVKCYEDLLDHMTREEVEAIGDIVQQTVEEFYPGSEFLIMGSYRRGKETCGDIDILITHPDHVKTTPAGALGKIVDKLRHDGHMSYHLTAPKGLTTPLDPDEPDTGHHEKKYRQMKLPGYDDEDEDSSQMYMGIINSPVPPHRKRRIDIKFYPYRERAFASIYFTGTSKGRTSHAAALTMCANVIAFCLLLPPTGNGFFNRSIRLYAKEYKGWSLNDHGLFRPDPSTVKRGRSSGHSSKERLPYEAETERDVFDVLGLVYKDPTERDCFDAVIPKNGKKIKEYEDHELALEGRHDVKWVD